MTDKASKDKLWIFPIFPGIGLLFGIMAGICASTCTLFLKLIPEPNPMMFLFVRSVTQLVFFIPMGIKEGIEWNAHKGEWLPLIGRCVFGWSAIAALYFSLEMIPLADATTIAFSSPAFVGVFAFFCLKEPCGLLHGIVVAVALTGVVLIGKPTFLFGDYIANEEILRLEGSLLALSCALLQGLMYVSLRKLRHTSSIFIVIAFSALSILFSSVAFLSLNDLRYPRCGWHSFYMLCGGFFSCVAQLLITIASKLENAGPLSLVRTVDIFMAFLYQILFFNLYPAWNSILGAVIIFVCVSIIGINKWRIEKPELFRPVEKYLCCANRKSIAPKPERVTLTNLKI